MNMPTKPKAKMPPSTPRKVSRNGWLLPRLIKTGRTTLSTPLIRTSPHTSMNTPQPALPWANSQSAAPPQTSGGPTGTSETTKVSTASSGTPGTPAIAKPSAATSACASAVPSKPYMTPRTVWLTVAVTLAARAPSTRAIVSVSTRSNAAPSRYMKKLTKAARLIWTTPPPSTRPLLIRNWRAGSSMRLASSVISSRLAISAATY